MFGEIQLRDEEESETNELSSLSNEKRMDPGFYQYLTLSRELRNYEIDEILFEMEFDEKLQRSLNRLVTPLRNKDLNSFSTACRLRNEYEAFCEDVFASCRKNGLELSTEQSQLLSKLGSNSQKANVEEWTKIKTPKNDAIIQLNKEVFGHETFLPLQKPIINAVLSGRDVFACLPTGGGKSLIFQLPALVERGFSLVIMPTISLIQDQLRRLNQLGLTYIHCESSSKGKAALTALKKYLRATKRPKSVPATAKDTEPKFVFLTPEKLNQNRGLLNILQELHKCNRIQRIVIDEAHCVSEWGHEFRISYLQMNLKLRFPNIQILAMTATATKLVRKDIIARVGLQNSLYFSRDLRRPNLRYLVYPRSGYGTGYKELSKLILKDYIGMTGIVYAGTRKLCGHLAQHLKNNGIIAAAYHGQISPENRKEALQKWIEGSIEVIVGTIAFGMGVDKPDVRFVIHYNFSKSVENYYQESGRAGRDGKPADCIILFNEREDLNLKNFLNRFGRNMRKHSHKEVKNDPFQREVDSKTQYQLRLMLKYCKEKTICRHKFQLLYLGQEGSVVEDCGDMCDNCLLKHHHNTINLMKEFREVLKFFNGLASHLEAGLPQLDDKMTEDRLKGILLGYRGHWIWHRSQEARLKKNVIFGLMRGQKKEIIDQFVESLVQGSYLKYRTEEEEVEGGSNKFHYFLTLNRCFYKYITKRISKNDNSFNLKISDEDREQPDQNKLKPLKSLLKNQSMPQFEQQLQNLSQKKKIQNQSISRQKTHFFSSDHRQSPFRSQDYDFSQFDEQLSAQNQPSELTKKLKKTKGNL